MVLASSKALWVNSLHTTKAEQIRTLRARWQRQICADDVFWKAAATKAYWTLIGLGRVRTCPPFSIEKYDRRAWVVINPNEHWWSRAEAQ